MMATPLALSLSLSNAFTEIGAIVAFAALLGIAVLSLLVFSQAREIRRLREWAGRAPERAVDLEQRVSAEAAARAQQPAAPVQAVRPVPRTTPLNARPATAGATSAATGPNPLAAGAAPAAAASPMQAVPGQAAQGQAVPGQAVPAPTGTQTAPGGVPQPGMPAAPQATPGSVAAATAAGAAAAGTMATQPGAAPAGGGTPDGQGTPGTVPPGASPSTAPPVTAQKANEAATTPPAGAARHSRRCNGGSASRAPGASGRAAYAGTGNGGDCGNGGEDVGRLDPARAEPAFASAGAPGSGERRSAASGCSERAGRPREPYGDRRGCSYAGSWSCTAQLRRAAPGARRAAGPPLSHGAPRAVARDGAPRRCAGRGGGGDRRGGAVAGRRQGRQLVLERSVSGRHERGNAHERARHDDDQAVLVQHGLGSDDESGAVNVVVLNGTTTTGLAHHVSEELQQHGYTKAAAQTGQPPGANQVTVVEYASGHQGDAQRVARSLGVTQAQPIESTVASMAGSASVVVIVGLDKA